METHLAQLDPVILLSVHQFIQDHGRADCLGNDGGNGHTCNPHVEPTYKQKIQGNIHETGHSQIDQGMF